MFIIQEVKDDEKYNYVGCSAGPLSDYVVVDLEGIKDPPASTMMHEMGHCCNIIGHPGTNLIDLMYGSDKEGEIFRGDNVRGWQRNLIRASRHVTYW